MKTISVNGEDYVKGTDIARELGYTADYVGQLCRSGEVGSTKVGRTWYVKPESIREHKKNRYRSTKSKSKKAISLAKTEKLAKENRVTTFGQDNWLKYNGKSFAYETDSSDLIPQTLKTEEVKKDVDLKKKEDRRSVSKQTSAINRSTNQEKSVPLKHVKTVQRKRVITMQRPPVKDQKKPNENLDAEINTNIVNKELYKKQNPRTRGRLFLGVSFLCTMFVFVVLIASVESIVFFSNGIEESSYVFNINNVLDIFDVLVQHIKLYL